MFLSNTPRPISAALQAVQTRDIETLQAILDREA